ncbi:MAG TPA: tRNA (adenosine(37)-N6)-threonylcarbamoyltransferase complex transferase subunit TsaD [Bacteroidia bacterium]|nr:tRNA (adenosine(37)-N6)-threonylcarbamoyltransferase complex transferase subunit TsaD [Bacteroidia bacterium]
MKAAPIYILGIESSCDETSAAILLNDTELSNVVANQTLIHKYYGGVVPELASRAHQQKIIPVVEEALRQANITKKELNAVAFTRGPGLMGALLVGVSFAKSLALGLNIPLIEVNHMQGHVLAHFIQTKEKEKAVPSFPFLCLTVSGGHTQIIRVKDYLDMEILGETQDDAAGEAFDKAAKIMGLPYPGGPLIDQLARQGNPDRFLFPHPQVPGLGFSFSGLKTAFLYFIRDNMKTDPEFIENNKADIAASIQKTIVQILLSKLKRASIETGIMQIAIAGGVSANQGLREQLMIQKEKLNWELFIPPFQHCTDNAAMIAMAGYRKYLNQDFSNQDIAPLARMPF